MKFRPGPINSSRPTGIAGLICLVFFAFSPAIAGEIRLSRELPPLSRCEMALQNELRGLSELTRGPISAGWMRELEDVLRNSGASPEFIARFRDQLARAKRRSSSHPLLRRSFECLESKVDTVVCVTGGSCSRSFQARGKFEALGAEWIWRFFRAEGAPVEPPSPRWASIFALGLKREQDLVTLKVGGGALASESEAKDVIETLLHEETHLADTELMSRWIQANAALMKKGLATDPLFIRYIKVESGVVVIDGGFATLFTESRGYEVIAALNELAGAEKTRFAERAIRAIETQSRGKARDAMAEMNATSHNLFDCGLAIGSYMERIIHFSEGNGFRPMDFTGCH